jgi:hypothetical protein
MKSNKHTQMTQSKKNRTFFSTTMHQTSSTARLYRAQSRSNSSECSHSCFPVIVFDHENFGQMTPALDLSNLMRVNKRVTCETYRLSCLTLLSSGATVMMD